MFSIKDFVMQTLEMMRNAYPQFQVMQYALSYYAKGWIGDAELMIVQSWYMPEIEPTDETEETPVEE